MTPGWDGMVIIGLGSSKSPFGANNVTIFKNDIYFGTFFGEIRCVTFPVDQQLVIHVSNKVCCSSLEGL